MDVLQKKTQPTLFESESVIFGLMVGGHCDKQQFFF